MSTIDETQTGTTTPYENEPGVIAMKGNSTPLNSRIGALPPDAV